MERAGIYRNYKGRFFLDEGKIRKISEVVNQHASKMGTEVAVLYFIQREDHRFYETKDLEIILIEDNCKGHRIERLVISIYDGGEKTVSSYCTVDFDKTIPSVNIQIDWKDRDWCFLFCDELENQITRIMQEDNILFSGLFPKILDKLIVPLGLLFVLAGYFYAINKSIYNKLGYDYDNLSKLSMDLKIDKILQINIERYNNPDTFEKVIFVCGLLMLLGMISIYSEPFSQISKMSPAVFYWGDMIKEYDANQKRKSKIIWCIIVALFVSLLAGILQKYLF